MLSELTVAYLIFGGIGAGCIGVCSVLDLVVVHEHFGDSEYEQGPAIRPIARVIDLSFAVGFALLGIGCMCLILDLGRIERVTSLFIHPSFSWMTVGAYSIAILLAVGAFLAIVRFLYLPQISRPLIVACEIVAVVLSIVVIVYVGMLLGTLRGVALWVSPWLPVLFAASSASGGIAMVVFVSLFVPRTEDAFRMLHSLALADMIVILVEAILVIAFLVSASTSRNPGAVSGFEQLTTGSEAALWWFGFVGCGVVVPFLIEAIFCFIGRFAGRSNSDMLAKVFVLGAAFVLIGVISMRIGIVDAGERRGLELQDPTTTETAGDLMGGIDLSEPSENERILYETEG